MFDLEIRKDSHPAKDKESFQTVNKNHSINSIMFIGGYAI